MMNMNINAAEIPSDVAANIALFGAFCSEIGDTEGVALCELALEGNIDAFAWALNQVASFI